MFLLVLLSPVPLHAQEEWEGKSIERVRGEGFRLHRFENFKSLLNARPGQVYTQGKKIQDRRKLDKSGLFNEVQVDVSVVQDRLHLTIRVVEYAFVDRVLFDGHTV